MEIILNALKSKTVWTQIIGLAILAFGHGKFGSIDVGAVASHIADIVTAVMFIGGIFFRVTAKKAIIPSNVATAANAGGQELPPF